MSFTVIGDFPGSYQPSDASLDAVVALGPSPVNGYVISGNTNGSLHWVIQSGGSGGGIDQTTFNGFLLTSSGAVGGTISGRAPDTSTDAFQIFDSTGTLRMSWNPNNYTLSNGVLNFNGANGNITVAAGSDIRADSFAGFTITGATINNGVFNGDGSGLTGVSATLNQTDFDALLGTSTVAANYASLSGAAFTGGVSTTGTISGIYLQAGTVGQFFVDDAGNVTTGGAISGSNLSGTNTGDQDLSGLVLASDATFTGAVSMSTPGVSAGSVLTIVGGADQQLIQLNASGGTVQFGSDGGISATGNITGNNLSGTNTGDQTSVTGNAGTATALQTARTINGTSFNGTANVTVTAAAGTLTGTALNSSVVTSGLTSAAGGSFGTAAFTAASAYEPAITVLSGAKGGTGVANAGKTITLSASFATTGGAFTLAAPASGSPTFTLPSTTGTLITANDNLNASNLQTGVVPDGRLPSTLPALNGSLLTALTAANITASTSGGRAILNLAAPSNGAYEVTWTGGVPTWTSPSGTTIVGTTNQITNTGGTLSLSSTLALPGTLAMSAAETISIAVAATTTDGLVLSTSTAATSGAQKWSPRIRLLGNSFSTTSKAIEHWMEVQPTASGTGSLVFSSQFNGSANTAKVSFDGLNGILITDQFGQSSVLSAGLQMHTSGVLQFGSSGDALKRLAYSDATFAFVDNSQVNFKSVAMQSGTFSIVSGVSATNYERFHITGSTGKVQLIAERGGTGAADVSIEMTPAGAGYVKVNAQLARVGGVLKDFYADAGNTSTTETDVFTYTTPASTLANNGEKLEAQFAGVFVSSATATRQLRVYFGGTLIFDSGALTLTLSSAWDICVLIIRTGTTTTRAVTSMTTQGAALSAYTNEVDVTGLTLSSTNILKLTGTAAATGAATNDILGKLGCIKWFPASA